MRSRAANRNPRRWTDRSGRVRVVEGWHPSHPDGLGYNLLIDDDWIGTFETLEGAATAAGMHGAMRKGRARPRQVALLPSLESRRGATD